MTPTSMLVLSIWPKLTKFFTFESFFQSHEGCVDGIFNFHIGFVSFLEEDFGVFGIFSDGSGFPVVEGSWGVDLGQVGSILIVTSNKDRDSKRSVSTSLSFLLDEFRSLSTKSLNGHWFIIFDEIGLDKFSGLLC